MVDPHRELWRQALRDLHGSGLTWIGIARQLECSANSVKDFASRNALAHATERRRYARTGSLIVNYYRARWILRVHAVMCPQHASHIAPLLEPDSLPSDEAVQRIVAAG